MDDVGDVYLQSIKEGWMTKQGRSFVPTWKRRYFVVVEKRIDYFADSAKTVLKGTYHLDADTDVEDMTDSNPNQFLITGKTSGKMYCRVDPGEDIHDWISKIQSAIPFSTLKSSSQRFSGEIDYSDPMFMKIEDKNAETGGARSLWDRLRGRSNADNTQMRSPTFAYNTSDMEGWVSKLGGFRKNWKKRYMVLDGNKLSYFTDETRGTQKNMLTITANTKINEHYHGSALPPAGECTFSLEFSERELVVSVADRGLKEDWIRLLMIAQNGGVLPSHMVPPEEEDDYFSKPKKNNVHDNVANFNNRLNQKGGDFDTNSPSAGGVQQLSLPSPSPRNSFTIDHSGVASVGNSPHSVQPDSFPNFSPTHSNLLSDSSPQQDVIRDTFEPYSPAPPPMPPSAADGHRIVDGPDSFGGFASKERETNSVVSWDRNHSSVVSTAAIRESSTIRDSSIIHQPTPPPPPTHFDPSSSETRGESGLSSMDERESFQEVHEDAPARMMIPTPAEIERAMAIKKEQEEMEKLKKEEEENKRKEEEERIELERQEGQKRIANLLQASLQSKSKDVLTAAINEAEGAGFSDPSCEYYELFLSALDSSHEMDEEIRRKELEKATALAVAERESEAQAIRESMRSQQRLSLDVAPIQLSMPSISELQQGQPDSDDEFDEVSSPQPPQHPPVQQQNQSALASAMSEQLSIGGDLSVSPPAASAIEKNPATNEDEDLQDKSSFVNTKGVQDVGRVDDDMMEKDEEHVGQGEEQEQEQEDEDSELSMEGWMKIDGKRRYVVLSDTTLIIYREVDKIKKKKNQLSLTPSCSVSLDANTGPLNFEIKDSKNPSNNLSLSVKTGAEMTSWMKALNKAINKMYGEFAESAGVRESALGLSMSIPRGSVVLERKTLVKNSVKPQTAIEKFKPQVRGFTRSNGNFLPMGPEYLIWGWLEVKLNQSLRFCRMFCTIESKEDNKMLTCYSDDDMKEVQSSIFLVGGQYTQESALLGQLAFVLMTTEKALVITLKAFDKSSKNEWCRIIEDIVTEWD